MVKLIKDDLTGKIFGYSDVRDNTCIYRMMCCLKKVSWRA